MHGDSLLMLTTKVVSNKKPPLLSDSESGGSTSHLLPVIGIISAYFTLNEPITMQKIISSIFIIFGVYVTTHSHKFVKNAH